MNEEVKNLKKICKGIQTAPSKAQMLKISSVLKTIKKKYNTDYVVVIRKINK